MLLDLTRDSGIEIRSESHPGSIVILTVSAEGVADGFVRREDGVAVERSEVSHLRGSPQTLWETAITSRDSLVLHELLIISTVRGLGEVTNMSAMRVEVEVAARPVGESLFSWVVDVAVRVGEHMAGIPMALSWFEPRMPGPDALERLMEPGNLELHLEGEEPEGSG